MKCCKGSEMKVVMMDHTCSLEGGDKKCLENFGVGPVGWQSLQMEEELGGQH
jgi:hypothetical protein